MSQQQKSLNTYPVHVVNLWNGESSNECCKPRKDSLRKSRHTLGDMLREREAGTSPFVYTHRTYVAGTVRKRILVHSYVVAVTVCKSSVHDATLKNGGHFVPASLRTNSKLLNFMQYVAETKVSLTCLPVPPFSPSMLRKLKLSCRGIVHPGPM